MSTYIAVRSNGFGSPVFSGGADVLVVRDSIDVVAVVESMATATVIVNALNGA